MGSTWWLQVRHGGGKGDGLKAVAIGSRRRCRGGDGYEFEAAVKVVPMGLRWWRWARWRWTHGGRGGTHVGVR